MQGREGISSGGGRGDENTKMKKTQDPFLLGTQHLFWSAKQLSTIPVQGKIFAGYKRFTL